MTLPFYPFYWGDYSAKTFDLTQGQHGAYMLFMRHVYTTGKNIDDNLRYQIAKAGTVDERNAADFVLAKYWRKKDGFWRHNRVSQIMDDAEKLHQSYVNKGKKPKKLSLSPRVSNHNHNQIKIKNKSLEEGKEETMAGTIPLDENSEPFKAWEDYWLKTKGKRPSRTDIRIDGRLVRGWYFPSVWPPGNVVQIERSA